MCFHLITTGIIVVGLLLTVYCVARLQMSHRVIVEYLSKDAPDPQQEDRASD
jgi:hypothetical protein